MTLEQAVSELRRLQGQQEVMEVALEAKTVRGEALRVVLDKFDELLAALERISDADGSNEPTWWGSSTSHLCSIARDALAARSPSRTEREQDD